MFYPLVSDKRIFLIIQHIFRNISFWRGGTLPLKFTSWIYITLWCFVLGSVEIGLKRKSKIFFKNYNGRTARHTNKQINKQTAQVNYKNEILKHSTLCACRCNTLDKKIYLRLRYFLLHIIGISIILSIIMKKILNCCHNFLFRILFR